MYPKARDKKHQKWGMGWARLGENLSKRLFVKQGMPFILLTNHTNKPMQHLFEKTGFSLIETTSVTGREAFGPFYIYKKEIGDLSG